MFIVREFESISKPQRGGMAQLAQSHVAPLGLGAIVGGNRYYKHIAPPELAEVRVFQAGHEYAGRHNPATSVDAPITPPPLILRRRRRTTGQQPVP